MRISVKVKPNSKIEIIEEISEFEFKVSLRAPAHEGKANQSLIKIISEYFDIPKSMVIILKGEKSRNKVIDIPG